MEQENIELIVFSIVGLLGRNTDEEFINTVRELVYTWRSKIIRQHLQRGHSKTLLENSITMNLEVSTLADICTDDLCTYLKTTMTLPEMVLSDVPFKVSYINNKGLRVFIDYVSPNMLDNIAYSKWTGKSLRFTFINGYIYLINNRLLEKINVTAIWDRPDKLEDYECTACKDSTHYLPGNIAADIRAAVLNELRVRVEGINGEIDEIKQGQ
jgi:hypothetical protein